MNRLVLFLILLLSGTKIFAQGELNCIVSIDASQVQLDSREKELLEEIKTAITNFLNSTKFTADSYNPEERIRCNLGLNVTSAGGGSYKATAQIQSSRPVYGGSYETLLLNFVDKNFDFSYTQGMVMQFNENIYNNELMSMLGFYANLILAMDYDSFSKLGGNPYIEKIRNIAGNAASNPSVAPGWKQLSDPNNRAGLTENLTNQLIMPVREGMYTYHRIVLDTFQKNREENLGKVVEVLEALKVFNNAKRPNAVFVKTFFNAKTPELVSIFSKATPEVKTKVVGLLSEMDPSNTQKYQKIMENR